MVIEPIRRSLEFLQASSDYVVIEEFPGLTDVFIDLRYGSTDNFSGVDQYGPLKQGYLHRLAAEKLARANTRLKELRSDRRLLVLDALRPRSVQRKLWEYVKGTPQEKYLASPERGSIHNYGFAIDLTLASLNGRERDLGTPFDTFNELAEPQHEQRLLAEGKLTVAQLDERRLLRQVMAESGFETVPHEWWHFEALSRAEVQACFPIVE